MEQPEYRREDGGDEEDEYFAASWRALRSLR